MYSMTGLEMYTEGRYLQCTVWQGQRCTQKVGICSVQGGRARDIHRGQVSVVYSVVGLEMYTEGRYLQCTVWQSQRCTQRVGTNNVQHGQGQRCTQRVGIYSVQCGRARDVHRGQVSIVYSVVWLEIYTEGRYLQCTVCYGQRCTQRVGTNNVQHDRARDVHRGWVSIVYRVVELEINTEVDINSVQHSRARDIYTGGRYLQWTVWQSQRCTQKVGIYSVQCVMVRDVHRGQVSTVYSVVGLQMYTEGRY